MPAILDGSDQRLDLSERERRSLAGRFLPRPTDGARVPGDEVVVDADQFRQLRARAAVRGDAGLPDLLAAPRLVSGPPFAQRPAGYEWRDGLDLTLTAAGCDVAHQVVTAALADDLAAAGSPSATALLVAPDDEQVLLDAMWVAFHQGNRAEAETYVARIVSVHDGEDEMDLPMSTSEPSTAPAGSSSTVPREGRRRLHRPRRGKHPT